MRAARVNDWLALKITNGVSTMWCAYLFLAISVWGLPQALGRGGIGLTYWISGDLLQLTLLSVIMVGQRVQAELTLGLHAKVDAHHSEFRKLRAALGGKP